MQVSSNMMELETLLGGLPVQDLVTIISGCMVMGERVTVVTISDETAIKRDNLYNWKKGKEPNDKKKAHEVISKFIMDCVAKMDEKEQDLFNKKVRRHVNGLQSEERLSEINNSLASTKETIAQDINNNYRKDVFVSIFIKENVADEVYNEGKSNAGTITEINGKPALIAINRASFFTGKINGYIEVPDESMEPEFPMGWMIGIRRLEYLAKYNSGYCYLIIDINHHIMLRKLVYESDEVVTLEPINKAYPPIKKNLEDILVIFAVQGRFRR